MTSFRYPIPDFAAEQLASSRLSPEAYAALVPRGTGPTPAEQLLGATAMSAQERASEERLEQSRADLTTFAEQIFPDNPEEQQEFQDQFHIEWDRETKDTKIWYIDPETNQPTTNYNLGISNRNLTGRLLIPKQLQIAVLRCHNNQLTTLPDLPPTLTELYCDNNQLTSLPDLPPTLTKLYCRNNQLTSLPNLPPTLTRLDCDNNQLTTLPDLPSTLTVLWCRDNQLTTLPDLLPTLTVLWCDNNQLTSLPDLPPTLTVLWCRNNQLTTLPDLPPALTELYCRDNQFDRETKKMLRQRGFSS